MLLINYSKTCTIKVSMFRSAIDFKIKSWLVFWLVVDWLLKIHLKIKLINNRLILTLIFREVG